MGLIVTIFTEIHSYQQEETDLNEIQDEMETGNFFYLYNEEERDPFGGYKEFITTSYKEENVLNSEMSTVI